MLTIIKEDSTIQFATTRVADVNVVYLPKSDMGLLLKLSAPMLVALVTEDGGAIFAVPTDGLMDMWCDQAKRFGFSDRFQQIVRECRAQGIDYVRFDVEGCAVQGLKQVQKHELESLAAYRPASFQPPPPGPELEEEIAQVFSEDQEIAQPQVA